MDSLFERHLEYLSIVLLRARDRVSHKKTRSRKRCSEAAGEIFICRQFPRGHDYILLVMVWVNFRVKIWVRVDVSGMVSKLLTLD